MVTQVMSLGRKAMGQQPGVVLEERLANWKEKMANQGLPSPKPLISPFLPSSLAPFLLLSHPFFLCYLTQTVF